MTAGSTHFARRSWSVNTASLLFIAFVTAFTLTAAVCDYRTKKLPNWLTVPGFAAALAFHAVSGGLAGGWAGVGHGLLYAFGGFGVGFGILLVLWLIGGGGAGDVKLMGALGAWFGAKHTFTLFLVSTVFVLVLSVGSFAWQMATRGMWNAKRKYLNAANVKADRGLDPQEAAMKHKVRRRLLPYGVPVALAAWVLLWVLRSQLLAS